MCPVGIFEVPKYLRSSFDEKRKRNRHFSIRSFARRLSIDAGTLSRYMKGTRIPTLAAASKLTEKLGLGKTESKQFLKFCIRDRKLRSKSSLNLKLRNRAVQSEVTISQADFMAMSEWYCMAILDLTCVNTFQSSAHWISSYLNIPEEKVTQAIDTLIKLGLLAWKRGKLVKTQKHLTTAQKEVTSKAHRENQKQFLKIALQKLESTCLEDRINTTVTMAIDPKYIPLARRLTSEFNQSLGRLLEAGDRTELYSASIAVYPLKEGGVQ